MPFVHSFDCVYLLVLWKWKQKNSSISIITITYCMWLWCVFVFLCVRGRERECVCGVEYRASSVVWKNYLSRAPHCGVECVNEEKFLFCFETTTPSTWTPAYAKFKACVRRCRCLKFSVFISHTKHFLQLSFYSSLYFALSNNLLLARVFFASFCRSHVCDRSFARCHLIFFLFFHSFFIFCHVFVCISNSRFKKKAKRKTLIILSLSHLNFNNALWLTRWTQIKS